ncbi:MAG: zinc-binding dehydrogenase [bacterium]|nr:zinc-binding dehydrogenase [bacterium]
MKAMVLEKGGAPFVMEERPDPVPGPGEAVARVLSCGSGLTIHHTRMGLANAAFPRIIGHEVLGEIVAVGPGVAQFSEGDAVTVYTYLSCGHCRWCRIDRESLCENLAGFVGRHIDGGYAEYLKLPAQYFIPIPEGIDYKAHPAEAAVISDAIVTPYKVTRRARIAPLETVAIFGAGGGVGLHMVMLAKWAHARVVAIDNVPEKLEKCREFGADLALDPRSGNLGEALRDFTKGKGIDVAVDFVSIPATLEAAVEALGRGGRLVTLGGYTPEPFRVSPSLMLANELELLGSRAFTKQELVDSLALVAKGDLWPYVTETYRLEEAEKVHARLQSGSITGRAAIIMD